MTEGCETRGPVLVGEGAREDTREAMGHRGVLFPCVLFFFHGSILKDLF